MSLVEEIGGVRAAAKGADMLMLLLGYPVSLPLFLTAQICNIFPFCLRRNSMVSLLFLAVKAAISVIYLATLATPGGAVYTAPEYMQSQATPVQGGDIGALTSDYVPTYVLSPLTMYFLYPRMLN